MASWIYPYLLVSPALIVYSVWFNPVIQAISPALCI